MKASQSPTWEAAARALGEPRLSAGEYAPGDAERLPRAGSSVGLVTKDSRRHCALLRAAINTIDRVLVAQTSPVPTVDRQWRLHHEHWQHVRQL